jgi:hypothetical protein
MQKKNLTKTSEWKEILSHFRPHKDYDIEDYYGFSLMAHKRNRKWSIKLLHDYVDGNSKTSNAIMIDDMEEAMEICKILQEFSKDKSESPKTVSLSKIRNKVNKKGDDGEWDN